VARWRVAPGGHPVAWRSMKKTHGCSSAAANPQKMIVMSTEDGKVEAALPIGAGVDATKADEGQAFASCRDGSLTVAAEKSGSYEVVQTLTTADGGGPWASMR